jgi:allantoinase
VVDIAFDDTILRIDDHIPDPGCEIIDLEGRILLPGVIDAHVHFNDPGFNEREDFSTGTASAAAGGITTVVDMPCTSLPPVIDESALANKLEAIRGKAVTDYALWGGIRGNDAPWADGRVERLWNVGVVGFKIYTVSGMDTFRALSYPQIADILKRFAGCLFAFHAEDPGVIAEAEQALPRPWRWREYVDSRPVEAEIVAVQCILDAGRENRLHIVHVGSGEVVRLLETARKQGVDVTFETAPHYLAFSTEDFAVLAGRLKTAPPVKSATDRAILRKALVDGLLDYIATDHAGCEWAPGKVAADFHDVYNGIPGCETLVPLVFDEFSGEVSFSRLADLLSVNPAKRLGLYPRKGALQVGSDADFTVLDTDRPYRFDEATLHCKGRLSPFQGREFRTGIQRTVVRGETVYIRDHGLVGRFGWGQWVRRNGL